MKCENLQLNLTVYLDDILTDRERGILDGHLARCPLCRQKLADFRLLRQNLRSLSRPVVSSELKNQIRQRVAAQSMAGSAYSVSENMRRWLQMRLMPYGLGMLTSLMLGFALLWTLLSSANNPQARETAQLRGDQPVMLNGGAVDKFYNDYELNAADFAAARISVAGDSPSLNPQGALVALTKSIVRGKMKDDEVVVVADVFGDGLARIAEVIEPSKDRHAVRELEKALKTSQIYAPPFVPAKLDQRSDSVRVVLKIQRVNVDTHLKN